MTLAIFLVISVIIIGIQTAVPFLVKRTVIFGVTIPEKHIKDERLMSFKKRYSLSVSLLSLVVLASYVIWVLLENPSDEHTVLIGTLIQFGLILYSLSLYFYFHAKIQQVKKNNQWVENLKQIKMTDLSVRAQDEMLPWHVYLLPIFITIGVICYTILQYDLLPNQIPTHWGINGEADAFKEKSLLTAISMPFTLLAILIMFAGMNIGIHKSGIKLSATSKNASRMRQLTLRKYSSWLAFFISLLVTVMFSFFQLKTIHPQIWSGAAMAATPIIFLVVVLAGTIAFSVKVGRSDKLDLDEHAEGMTDYDDDVYWKGGLFYFNKQDPSIFVEKRFGVGWTLNFANPIGYLIVLVPLIAILVFSLL